MKTVIEIKNMEFYAFHGCYETERKVGNKFLVNVVLHYDGAMAAESDDITKALNYVDVYELVKQEMSVTSHLLEHVAKRIIDAIRLKFREIEYVEVKVSKLNPPIGGRVCSTSVVLVYGNEMVR